MSLKFLTIREVSQVRRNPRLRVLVAVAVVVLYTTTVVQAQKQVPQEVAVVVGAGASELERYAAEQLRGYIKGLFGAEATLDQNAPRGAKTVFFVGRPDGHSGLEPILANNPLPKLSVQGILLKRVQFRQQPALIVAGGSPAATLWAVYELVQRWGVHYLIHRDVLPKSPGRLRLPAEDLVLEPQLKVRQMRVLNEHAWGPTSWGMGDFKPIIDQLAKLKFNRVLINTWPSQPWLDLKVRGIRRQTGEMYFGRRFPIADDMIGRHLFGNATWYMNPDVPAEGSYQEKSKALQRLLHNMMDYAHQRGMECILTAHPTEFPIDFAPLLGGGQEVLTSGLALTVAPKKETMPDDPILNELATAVLRATVNTYPEADFIQLHMPEWRQWIGVYEHAWKELDKRYGVARKVSLEAALTQAKARGLKFFNDEHRCVDEVKGDIVMLYFLDRLFNDLKVLEGTARPNTKLIYSAVAEELFPVLPQIMKPGSETLVMMDYTPARSLAREGAMASLAVEGIPPTQIFTLQDDNTGMVPLLETRPLEKLTQALMRYGWAGFSTRYWLLGDHDSVMAYLSRAAWDPSVTADQVARDQVRALLGSASVEDMLTVFREVGAATEIFEFKSLSFLFPVPEMVTQYWKVWKPRPFYQDIRAHYERALQAAQRASAKAKPGNRGYADYWVKRLQYGIGMMELVESIRLTAKAQAENRPDEAIQRADQVMALARRNLEVFVSNVQDQSDRGAVAVMNEYMIRALEKKVSELKQTR